MKNQGHMSGMMVSILDQLILQNRCLLLLVSVLPLLYTLCLPPPITLMLNERS